MATDQLKNKIVSALKDPILKKINFSLQGAPVDGSAFEKIAELVESGKIGIAVDNTSNCAQFEWTPNKGLKDSRFIFPDDVPHPGTIVHEGVHAILVFRGCLQTSGITGEAAAYIVDILYPLLKHGSIVRGRLSMPAQSHLGWVNREALKIIDKFDLTRKSVNINWMDYQELRLAISTMTEYKDYSL